MTIFTLSQQTEPSALIILPEKICNPNRAFFLNAKVLTPAKLKPEEVAFAGIPDPAKSSYNKKELTEYLTKIHQYVETMGIKVIAVGISAFWQALTDNKKFTLYFGRTLNGTVFKNSKEKLELDFSEYKICGFLNPILLNKYPNKLKEVVRGLSVIKPLIDGEEINSEEKVSDVLKINKILTDPDEAYEVLVKLFYEPQLTCDIETTGLRWYADEMLTLSFSPRPGEAYCFAINYRYHNKKTEKKFIDILGRFFKKYKGEIIGHNFTAFDTAFIVHYIIRDCLFEERHEPIIDNLNLTDTMLMAYLLQNSTERPSIGLKEITFKWLGEYDSDVDQRFLERYPLETVATYNNLDVHATWLAYNELKPKIDKEFSALNKEYQEIAVDLLKLKMNGIRVDRGAASEFLKELSGFIKKDRETMLNNRWIKLVQRVWAEQKLQKYNETHKNKKEDWEEFVEEFNPNSPKQKYLLFFELMDLPPIKHSKKTKLPSADQESLNTWMSDENIPEDKREAIVAISEYTLATKILNSYIKIMAQDSIEVASGDFRIFADFNLTGTISGRLSSSGMINLQTIPSKSKYASFVKKMLIAPDGCVIATADYSALEDRLIANASGDTNKINTFEKGIDGHCLNSYFYFKQEFEERGIIIEDLNDPEQVNKIKELAPDLRQKSKPYTFGFSYGAGPKKYGEELYNAYWQAYSGVRNYKDKVLSFAREKGYWLSEYSGLRLFCPNVNSPDDFIRESEERVVFNFATQSGNFLMLRAIHKLGQWIKQENLYDKIQIINTVHDSVYLYVEEDLSLIKQVNEKLISAMCDEYNTQGLPVPLEAELDLGYNMKELETIPNNCGEQMIAETLQKLKKGGDNEVPK